MIVVKLPLRVFGWFSSDHVWLAERPRLRDSGRLTIYYSCDSNEDVRGYRRFAKSSLAIDLKAGAEAVLEQCSTSLAYKIKRARREDVDVRTETDLDRYLAFYNNFAGSANLPLLSHGYLTPYWPQMVVTAAWSADVPVSMHAYIKNPGTGRVSLLYSASHFRNEPDSSRRSFLSRANRFHYWDDMRRFAAEGLSLYDFGYFGEVSGMEGVNAFKNEFPCFVRPVSTYVSLPMYYLRTLRDQRASF